MLNLRVRVVGHVGERRQIKIWISLLQNFIRHCFNSVMSFFCVSRQQWTLAPSINNKRKECHEWNVLLQWATWVIYNVPPGDSFTQQEREKQTRYFFEATREILHLLLKNKNETDRFCESWWWGRNLRSRTCSITFLQMRARTFSIAFSGFTSENPLKARMAVIDEQNRKKRKVFTIIISRSGT